MPTFACFLVCLPKHALHPCLYQQQQGTSMCFMDACSMTDCIDLPSRNHLFFFNLIRSLLALFFFKNFIFNWRVIALQCRVGFCYTATWISHRYTYVHTSPTLEHPSHLPSHPTPLSHKSTGLSSVYCVTQQIPTCYLFYTRKMHMLPWWLRW